MVPGVVWIAERRPFPMLRWLAAGARRAGAAAHRLGAAHRRQGRRHHAALQLAALRLWRAGSGVLGRRLPAAQARRRRADAHGRSGRDPVHRAARVPQIRHYINSGDIYRPARGLTELALQVSAGWRWRSGSNACAAAPEHRPQRRRDPDGGLEPGRIVLGLALIQQSAVHREPVGGPFFNLILLGYGLPAVLAIALALVARNTRPMPYRVSRPSPRSRCRSLYLTLEVRGSIMARC